MSERPSMWIGHTLVHTRRAKLPASVAGKIIGSMYAMTKPGNLSGAIKNKYYLRNVQTHLLPIYKSIFKSMSGLFHAPLLSRFNSIWIQLKLAKQPHYHDTKGFGTKAQKTNIFIIYNCPQLSTTIFAEVFPLWLP